MNTHDFSQDILARIESEQIAPRSRVMVLARRALWWMGAVVTIMAGGIAFATILYFAREQEWSEIFSPHAMDAFRVLPFLWIGAFFLFASLTVLDVRAMPRGYRHETFFLLGMVLVASVGVGGIVYAIGYEDAPHYALTKASSTYQQLVPDPVQAWNRPALGRYTGVVSATSSQGFVLLSPEGEEVRVLMASTSHWFIVHDPTPGIVLKMRGVFVTSGTVRLIEARPLRKRPSKVFDDHRMFLIERNQR